MVLLQHTRTPPLSRACMQLTATEPRGAVALTLRPRQAAHLGCTRPPQPATGFCCPCGPLWRRPPAGRRWATRNWLRGSTGKRQCRGASGGSGCAERGRVGACTRPRGALQADLGARREGEQVHAQGPEDCFRRIWVRGGRACRCMHKAQRRDRGGNAPGTSG